MNEQFLRLSVALAIGLLVGLERGWRERDEAEGSRAAGIRTYGICGLLGGILATVALALASPPVVAAGFLGFAAIFGWFEFHEAQRSSTFSVTGTLAGLAVFALGALAVIGDYRLAAAAGTALAALLASREVLHELLKRLTWPELRSALVLAVMTTIILPLLPDRTIDPWNGLNPAEIWLFTVIVAAISYAGYVAVRVLGARRGLLVSGLAGAVVSSTAVTVALGRTARTQGNGSGLAGAAALAAMVSVLRVCVIVLALRPAVFATLAFPALAGAATFALGGVALLSSAVDMTAEAETARNPFELRALLLFAAMFAIVSTASAALVGSFGASSLVGGAAVSGTFDVDVAVLSALRLTDQAVPLQSIGNAVLAALAANAAGRLFLAILSGPRAFWLPLLATTTLAVAAGAGTFALTAAG